MEPLVRNASTVDENRDERGGRKGPESRRCECGNSQIVTLSTFNRFTVYKTWRHDSSVVYRLTTWTNATSFFGNLLRLGVKTNIIFLKVQKPGFISAYDALKRAGLELDPAARNGLSNTVGSMAVQKAAFWQTTSGNDIMSFCRRNAKNLEVGVKEVGYMRIFTIIWAPEGGKIRRDDMDAFIEENFRFQLTHARAGIEGRVVDSIVWAVKTALLADPAAHHGNHDRT